MRFTDSDVDRFAASTGDHNPLHTSASYAHTTPFGRPVVFGVLGALRALNASPAPVNASARPLQVRLTFPRPLFRDVEYGIEVSGGANGLVALLDGGERALWVTANWTNEPAVVTEPRDDADAADAAGRPPRTVANTVEHPAGTELEGGSYVCDATTLRDVVGGDALSRWTDTELAAIAFTSYLAGMECPGEQALLTEITVEFTARGDGTTDGLAWSARVARFDERFRLLTLEGEVRQHGGLVAQLRVRATVRPRSVPLSIEDVAAHPAANSASLRTTHALVVGGSRGLGAALVAHLALAGADVRFTYGQSADRAAALAAALAEHGGTASGLRGDAGDPAFWTAAADDLGPIDLVICSAWPPMVRVPQSEAGIAAASEHVAAGFAMVAAPLMQVLPTMPDGGTVVVVSSHLVTEPDPVYWHYTSAKAAVEGLCSALAVRYPKLRFVIVRPKVIATDYVNVVTAQSPMQAADAARRILELCTSGSPGLHVETLS